MSARWFGRGFRIALLAALLVAWGVVLYLMREPAGTAAAGGARAASMPPTAASAASASAAPAPASR